MKWQEKGSRATSDLLGARLYREQANSRGKIVNINSLEAVFRKNGSLGQDSGVFRKTSFAEATRENSVPQGSGGKSHKPGQGLKLGIKT